MADRGADGETGLGGARRDFPSTCWSRLGAGPADGPGGAAALEEFARSYWKPVYAYIRASSTRSNEDAKDTVQDFFLWIIESGFLARADPARGRFRAFIKTSLRHYLVDEERKRRAEKRGGGRTFIPMEALAGSEPAAPVSGDPERILDERWRDEIVDRASAALEDLMRREGRESYFRIFRDLHLKSGPPPGFRELAARHGVGEQEIENALRYARRRFRALAADIVAETVGDPAELESEWNALFGAEGG